MSQESHQHSNFVQSMFPENAGGEASAANGRLAGRNADYLVKYNNPLSISTVKKSEGAHASNGHPSPLQKQKSALPFDSRNLAALGNSNKDTEALLTSILPPRYVHRLRRRKAKEPLCFR